MAAMLAAGLFEYNFGDSEFLMLFLVLVTLPFAALPRRDLTGRDAAPRQPECCCRRPPERAQQIARGFAGAHVLVIGDAMLDKFIVGRVTRISPEAPVPVVAFDHEMHRIGGAANVAHNITALGGPGDARGGHRHRTRPRRRWRAPAARPASRRRSSAMPTRPTTTKVRIVTERNQQVARIDYEADTEIPDEIEQRLIAEISKHAPRASAIVISDYLKGCVTRAVVQAAVAAAAERGVPVLVDPKIPHVDYYAGATLVTPNHHEAEIATNMRVRSEDEARGAARLFRDRAQCGAC